MDYTCTVGIDTTEGYCGDKSTFWEYTCYKNQFHSSALKDKRPSC